MKPIRPLTILLVLAVLLPGGCSSDDPVTPRPETGTVVIDNPETSTPIPWTCQPPTGDPITGDADTTLTGMPVGEYSVTWDTSMIRGTINPRTGTLEADSTLHFVGVVIPDWPRPGQEQWLFDVTGTAANDVYAVGQGGTLLHFDGMDWSRVELGVRSYITRITADPGGTIWVCGHEGRVWRGTGSSWDAMNSGTTENLFAIGWYQGQLHTGGSNGTLRRLDGETWVKVGTSIILRDAGAGGAPIDTLDLDDDIMTVTTIGHHAIGGSFYDPDYEGEIIGLEGTIGMVLRSDTIFDWEIVPFPGENGMRPSWVMCSTSDPIDLSNNYLGSMQGWLYQLQDTVGRPTWARLGPQITDDSFYGIRDIWLDGDGNQYLVTDEGAIVYRTVGGVIEVLHDRAEGLYGIWGSGPDNFYVVGLLTGVLLRCDHDPVAGTIEITEVDVKALMPTN